MMSPAARIAASPLPQPRWMAEAAITSRPKPARAEGPVALISHDGSRLARRLGASGLADLVRAGLGPAAGAVLHVRTSELTDAIGWVADSAPRAIAVVGGDGTARTALEQLADRAIPVIPLPGGTLNRLSRRLYGGGSAARVLARAAAGRAAPLAGGRVGTHRFFVASGYGPLMRANGLREALRHGRSLEAFRAAWHETFDGAFAKALQARGLAGGFDAAVVAVGRIEDAFGLGRLGGAPVGTGGLDVALGRWSGLASLIAQAPTALSGHWRASKVIANGLADRLELTRTDTAPLPALLDGEPVLLPGSAHITFDPACGLVLLPDAQGQAAPEQWSI